METSPAPVEVFYSFAEVDAPLLEQLENHLSVLRNEELISTWHKRQIAAGSDLQVEVDRHLDTASLILLLISPGFLASAHHYGVELQRAMERSSKNEARVIPILLRPCDWQGTPFEKLKVIPHNGKAITSWRNRDEAFAEIAKEIRAALKTIQGLTPSTPSTTLPTIWHVPSARNPGFTGSDLEPTPILSLSLPERETREKRRGLPTFEIGECTPGSPFEMQCTGEIITGVDAAARVVEEIELDTKPSDNIRFDVRFAGIDRIRDYLATIGEPTGSAMEDRHKLRMALRDWEKHLKIFRTGVEYVLWNSIFQRSSGLNDTRGAAEIICGLSRHCFSLPPGSIGWHLWYENEQKTLRTFYITEKIEDFMENGYYEDDAGSKYRRKGLMKLRAYPIKVLFPEIRYYNVIPTLLIYIAEQRINGTHQAELDKYLDVSRWKWSVLHPSKFLELR